MEYYQKFAMQQWLGRCEDLTWREKAIWQILSEYQRSNGYSFVSQEQLMFDADISRTQLQAVLRSLRQKMYLVSKRLGTAREAKGQNIYAVCIPSEWDTVRERVANTTSRRPNKSRQTGASTRSVNQSIARSANPSKLPIEEVRQVKEATTTPVVAISESVSSLNPDQEQEALTYLQRYTGDWKFMLSLKAQVASGKTLSPKQLSAVVKNMEPQKVRSGLGRDPILSLQSTSLAEYKASVGLECFLCGHIDDHDSCLGTGDGVRNCSVCVAEAQLKSYPEYPDI